MPIPPADPTGIIAPPGCAETTFTGSNPDLAVIAHHASRVAIDRLLGNDGLGGDVYVAHLRDPRGEPRPATWQALPMSVHPLCPLHPG